MVRLRYDEPCIGVLPVVRAALVIPLYAPTDCSQDNTSAAIRSRLATTSTLCEHRDPRLLEQRPCRRTVDLQPPPVAAEHPVASIAVDQQTGGAAVQPHQMRDILLSQVRSQPIAMRDRLAVALAQVEQERQQALAGVRAEQRFNP